MHLFSSSFKTGENARFSGQTADGHNFRRLHRFRRTLLACPEFHRIRRGIVEATGARSRRSEIRQSVTPATMRTLSRAPTSRTANTRIALEVGAQVTSMEDPMQSTPKRLACAETWAGNAETASLIDLPGLSAWVCSVPVGSDHGGGDVHYLSLCPSCIVSRIALADVSGHGETVAALGEKLRELIQV